MTIAANMRAGARVSPGPPAAGSDAGPARVAAQAEQAAALLLSQILARLHEVASPVIQFVPCSAGGTAALVAHEFGIVSARGFGRTLLTSVRGITEAAEADGLAWPGSNSLCPEERLHPVVPDAGVCGLYHAQLVCLSRAASAHDDIDAIPRMPCFAADFRMSVLVCPAPSDSSEAVILAARCHGSILTVAAGATRLSDLLTTASVIAAAGGKLLGTVLHDAPPAARWPWK